MPTFEPGVVKTAIALIHNPTTKGFDYEAILYLGLNQIAWSRASFRLEPGESKSVNFTITMPSESATYPVFLDISSAGTLLAHYQASEDVVITVAAGLYGIVTDAETGVPLSIVLVSIAAPYEQSVFTDSNGYYAFPNLQPSSYTVYFNKDGYWVERVPLSFTQASYQLNVQLSAPSVGEDHFVSCEVPTQIARGTIPPFGGFGGTAEFWASHRVWLMAREGLLYDFELLIDKTGVPIDPTEYAQPWYGVSEADVLWLWSSTPPPYGAGLIYLPTPAQLQQLFPVEANDFYESSGLTLWNQITYPASLSWNCSTVSTFPWYVPPPRGIYRVISRCSVVPCSIEGATIRTWGSWQLLWEVDTGKTIEVV